MPGRVSVKGKPRKPKLFKNTSETFTFKAAVLAHYDKATLSAVIQTFWPGIELRSKTYNTKKRVILRWKENRLHIKTMADNTRTAHMKRFRNHGAAKTLPDEAELDILEWLLALRSHGVPISAQMLAIEAREVAKMYDIPPTAFAASHTWIKTYLSRYSLSLRARTRQGQTTPADSEQIAREFAATVRRRIVDENITRIYNADQTAIFFEYIPKHTVNEHGAKTVWVKCAGKSKERLTAMLMADSTGKKYEPWVVLKMRPSSDADIRAENHRLRQGFSRRLSPRMKELEKETSTTIFTNAKGWWNSDLSLQFLNHYFGDRDENDDPIMLLWDDFSAHWTAEVVAFAAARNVILQRVPPGYTHCCQPADISWNKPLKDRIRTCWIKYLQAQCARLARCDDGAAKMQAPSREDVLRWLEAAWNGLSRATVKSGFKRISLLFDERQDTPSRPHNEGMVDNDLVETLVQLSCVDKSVGEVSWDDDVVDRFLIEDV